jgi:hypothetical protein
MEKKSGQKHPTALPSPPRPPFPLVNQPHQPLDNEVALLNLEIQYLLNQLRRFSRCRRPSLSSKRPLRACQLTPARLQSSSLNEIPNSVRPSTKFRRLSPSRARLRFRKRGSRSPGQGKPAFELKSTGYYRRPSSLGLEATSTTNSDHPLPQFLSFAASGPPPC